MTNQSKVILLIIEKDNLGGALVYGSGHWVAVFCDCMRAYQQLKEGASSGAFIDAKFPADIAAKISEWMPLLKAGDKYHKTTPIEGNAAIMLAFEGGTVEGVKISGGRKQTWKELLGLGVQLFQIPRVSQCYLTRADAEKVSSKIPIAKA